MLILLHTHNKFHLQTVFQDKSTVQSSGHVIYSLRIHNDLWPFNYVHLHKKATALLNTGVRCTKNKRAKQKGWSGGFLDVFKKRLIGVTQCLVIIQVVMPMHISGE